MNKPRMLAGLLFAAVLSGEVCAFDQNQRVMTIEQLFEVAESQSTQLKPMFSASEEARQGIREARSQRLPDISANLSLSYIGDGFTTKRDFTDYQKAPIPHFGNTLSVDVTQPLYTGGAITAGIDLAELKLTASRFATDLQRDNLRFRLAGYYLDIYKYNNLRTVVNQNIAQARQVLGQMRERHLQGTALLNDITRYELLVSNLELQLVKIENTLDILNNDLVTIACLPLGTEILPDSTILFRSLPAGYVESWSADALKNSPMVNLARSKVDISSKAESLAKAERLPKIVLQAGWNFDGPILVEVPPINRNLSYWYVGLGVSYNISSLFKTNKSIARSQAATMVARDELAVAEQDVELNIRAAHVRYLEAYQELVTQQKSVELADRNYNIVATRYDAEMALITDMLDAANSKLDAEQRLVNAHINIIYYYYKLLFTSGKI